MKSVIILCCLCFTICFSQQWVKEEYMAHDAQAHENITNTANNDELLNIFIVPHTHDDPGWLVTTDQYYFKQVRFILDTIIPVLKANKDRKFTFVEQAYFQKWWTEQGNYTRNEIRKLVQNGQLEMNLGGWSMTDEAGAHYEDIINEMTLGHKFIYDEFGVRPKVGWQIDPFGHSNQVSSLYADMGFDGYSIYRIHHDDCDKRMNEKKLEFVWRGSKSLDKESDIFLSYLDTGYKAPGECELFSQYTGGVQYYVEDEKWVQWDDELPTFKVNVGTKADQCVEACKKRATWHDNGNNLLIVWGADFTFQNAFVPFENMDKLIEYVNAHQNKYHVKMQYAVLSDYIKAVHEHDKKWDIKRDDFFPYAREESAYWTGYYTSRDRLKGIVREKMNELSNAEMYLALSKATNKNMNFKELYSDILKLRKAQGEVQHHDAITGTEKQAVANDYNVQLIDGAFFTNKAASEMLNVYTTLENLNKNSTEIFPKLNKENSIVVVLSNNVAWSRKETIQIILPRSDIGVYDKDNNEIESQINEIPEFSYDRRNGTYYLYFVHEISAMGYSSVYLKIKEDSIVTKPIESDSIKNDKIELNFENGYAKEVILSSGQHMPLNANLYHYKSAVDLPQSSGAYAFVPAYEGLESIGSTDDIVKTTTYTVDHPIESENVGYLIETRSTKSYDDVIVSNLNKVSSKEFSITSRRLDGDKDQGWGQKLAMNYIAMDLNNSPKNTERGFISISKDQPLSFTYQLIFKTSFVEGTNVHLFMSPVLENNGFMTTTILNSDNKSASILIKLNKADSWCDNNGFYYIAFTDESAPFEEFKDQYIYGSVKGTTDNNGFKKITVESNTFAVNNRIFVQIESNEEIVPLVGNAGETSFEINAINVKKSGNIDFIAHYLIISSVHIGDYIIPETTDVKTTVIKGNLVEEVQQTYRNGYNTIFRLYKQGIQANIIEVNTELNGVDDGHEVVLKFSTNLKNSKTIYSDTVGMEQQKRVFNGEFTQPIAGNIYPIVSRAYIEDENEDTRLSVLVDRAHGISSLEDGVMEIMLKRRTIGDDGYGVNEPLIENDQVKEKFWFIVGKKEESTIYKQYDILMNHYPVQFFGIKDSEKNIIDNYSSIKTELPPQIQLLNFQLAGVEDKTFILRLHHIYEKDESIENSISVEVDISKIFKDFEIVDYEEMILTGMFKKSVVEEERMKWKTIEDDESINSNMNNVSNEKKTSIRGSKSFIITLKPMEFKTFQVTIA